ncbi:MAG: hypothetical protein FVQ81_14945 [Candidatus Glassbacteria bacterium]|nr:hypothetical protein [Candidatus Glassbacteria bacterium]
MNKLRSFAPGREESAAMLKIPESSGGGNGSGAGGDKLVPLLEERSRTRKTIGLIEARRGEVQDDVLEKVRADYVVRLENLNREIARQARNFQSTLKDYRELVGLLENADRLAVLSLEELKVRHELGEYDEQKFREISAGKRDKMSHFRQKLESYHVNMQRLENVLSQLES